MIQGSYKLESFTENVKSEVIRLKYQVDLFYQREIELYKRIGLKDGMTLIECGSGPGFLISNILRDLPLCKATALEIDPFFIRQLNKISEVNGKRLFEVKHASVYDTEMADNSYDFAIARLVLEHLQEPERAIAEIRRILKPGGKLVLVSNDFAYHLLTYPHITELDEMYGAYIQSRISQGGNPLIGRQMPSLLKKGNFESVKIEIICVHSDLEGDKPFLKAENVNISKNLVKEGFLKKEVLDSLIENWYNMLQDPDHAIFRQLFVISGTKGGNIPAGKISLNKEDPDFQENQVNELKKIKSLTGSKQKALLSAYLLNKVKTILETDDLAIDTKLNDIDIDSIAAAEIAGVIKSDFNTAITVSEILQEFSINDIISLIINNRNSNPAVQPDNLVSDPGSNWLEGEL